MFNEIDEITHYPDSVVSLFAGKSKLEKRLSAIRTQAKLKKEISQVLECPVCLEQCQNCLPFICRNGHLICSQCKTKGNISLCPTCRSQSLNEFLGFKDLVQKYDNLPCPHRCDHISADDNERKEHLKTCLSDWRKCPLPFCDDKNPGLNYRQHLISQHPDLCYSFGGRVVVDLGGENPNLTTVFFFGTDDDIVMVHVESNFRYSASYLSQPASKNSSSVNLVVKNEKTAKQKTFQLSISNDDDHEGGLNLSYQDIRELKQIGLGKWTIAVHISISSADLLKSLKHKSCSHGRGRCLLVCPDLTCNKPFPCDACHDECNLDHKMSLERVREVICLKCCFVQTKQRKCVSCHRALVKTSKDAIGELGQELQKFRIGDKHML